MVLTTLKMLAPTFCQIPPHLFLHNIQSKSEITCFTDKNKKCFINSCFSSNYSSKKMTISIGKPRRIWRPFNYSNRKSGRCRLFVSGSSKKLSKLIDRIKIFCKPINRKRKLSTARNKEFKRRSSISKRPYMNIILLPRNIMMMMRKEGGIELTLIGRNTRKRISSISIKWFLFPMEAVHTGSLLFCIIWVVLM
jgi:hypothetical protein